VPPILISFEPDAVSNSIDYAKFYNRSHDPVIRVYDDAGNVIETHDYNGEFKEGDFLLASPCLCRLKTNLP